MPEDDFSAKRLFYRAHFSAAPSQNWMLRALSEAASIIAALPRGSLSNHFHAYQSLEIRSLIL
jgi:hypothetical protein